MKLLVLSALLASTCFTPPKESPGTTPDPVPYPVDDASAPVNDPATQCSVAWSVMADAACAPVKGFDAWMTACSKYPQATIDCVMTVESCASMRNCQGFEF